jgi:hypothetical protein
MKTLFIIATIAVAVFLGAKWINKNPHSTDIQKISPPVYQLPGPQNPYGK